MDFIIPMLIVGLIVILLIGIYLILKLNGLQGHQKVEVISIIGLISIASFALILSKEFDDITSLVAVASAAVGGIAGFLAHKEQKTNLTVLSNIPNQEVIAGNTLEFILSGLSTLGYNLNYSMNFSPNLSVETPEENIPTLNQVTGEFKWVTKEDLEQMDYDVTFTVTDGMGGTDSRTIKISIYAKKNGQASE